MNKGKTLRLLAVGAAARQWSMHLWSAQRLLAGAERTSYAGNECLFPANRLVSALLKTSVYEVYISRIALRLAEYPAQQSAG